MDQGEENRILSSKEKEVEKTFEEIDTIEEVYEPFLMQIGFLHRTPRGRVATDDAYRHLGLTPPKKLL